MWGEKKHIYECLRLFHKALRESPRLEIHLGKAYDKKLKTQDFVGGFGLHEALYDTWTAEQADKTQRLFVRVRFGPNGRTILFYSGNGNYTPVLGRDKSGKLLFDRRKKLKVKFE